jgi:anti-sigma regulatory factor (Ser/Thr protein kinase)
VVSGIRERSNSDGHVVKIYDDDRDLARGVSAYLAAGLRAGDVVIVVTTPAHREAFEQALEGSVDLPARTAEGSYVPVDAKDLLAELMVDDSPDPARFSSVLGDLLATANGRPVRIFGEMVSVLWDRGNITAAIALESLWNELATRHEFSLYCAYAMAAFESASDLASLRDVCDHHTDIVGPESHSSSRAASADAGVETTISEFFVPVPVAIRSVRQFVQSTLLAWGETELLEDAAVVISELATNAVRHARSPFRVSISREQGTIRLMVHDGSGESAEAQPLTTDAEGGRGLSLVAALCPTWGTEHVADGKIVWAELVSRN